MLKKVENEIVFLPRLRRLSVDDSFYLGGTVGKMMWFRAEALWWNLTQVPLKSFTLVTWRQNIMQGDLRWIQDGYPVKVEVIYEQQLARRGV